MRALGKLESFRNPQSFHPKNLALGRRRQKQAMTAGARDLLIHKKVL